MSKHLTRHRMESVDAASPSSIVDAAARVHLAECDRCAVRKRALDRARQHHLETHPAAEFVRAVQARAELPAPSPRKLRLAFGVRVLLGLVVAAAVVAAAVLMSAVSG